MSGPRTAGGLSDYDVAHNEAGFVSIVKASALKDLAPAAGTLAAMWMIVRMFPGRPLPHSQ